jgi:hypothetical protein
MPYYCIKCKHFSQKSAMQFFNMESDVKAACFSLSVYALSF